MATLLDTIASPADLRALDGEQLRILADEVRQFVVHATSVTGGHLGSNLGVVELTFALHRAFDSPRDLILWDTGHQAYVHKLVTGRREMFWSLRQAGGLSGYPNRAESSHDWIENSHASTVLSYAQGWAEALKASGEADRRHVIAVIGDGSMTGGMAYEALNNLGHENSRVLVILNDNGRSYAPTVSKLTRTVSRIRTMPSYARGKKRSESLIERMPVVGDFGMRTVRSVKAALREAVGEPHAFFETLGVRYVGPIDGHDVLELERTLRDASTYEGAIVVHVLTNKGKGYSFAEDDDEKNLHDVGTFDPITGPRPGATTSWTDTFSETLLRIAADHPEVHAITAAMPGPTGLLPFQARFPARFHDVGIAEQHAVTMAAGMAMAGLRPVVALYSTFLARAFDQCNLDVGLHKLPVVFALDRAGITGPDGASHHGVLDMALLTKIPGITVLAPSSAEELEAMLYTAIGITHGPVAVRYPRGVARHVDPSRVGTGLLANKVIHNAVADVCIVAVGRVVEAAEQAAALLADEKGIPTSVWDVRCCKPLDPNMVADAADHRLVITIEDGVREGGVGAAIADHIGVVRAGRPSVAPIVLGTPIEFIGQGSPNQILADLGLDAVSLVDTIAKAYEQLDANVR